MNTVIRSVCIWAEMVKLPHSVFALPFALMAAFLAGRNIEGRAWPFPGQVALIVACMVAARSVAMTFNRIVDAKIDARNPRTADRPLPTRKLSFPAAWLMVGLFAAIFVAGCYAFHRFYGNPWPMLLACPVLLFLAGYSFAKRFTRWCHFYLGAAIAFAPVAAWLAVHPSSLGLSALVLMVTVACWIAGFDIIYACQDIEVDRRDGLYSLPARLGPHAALLIARCSHILAAAGLVLLGFVEGLGLVYAIGVAIAAVLLVVENALVSPGEYSRVNLAFFSINGIVSVVLAIAMIVDVFLAWDRHGV